MEREVTLMEMLEAREAQDALWERYGVPVISFTLNIAGPVKDSPIIRQAFRWGQEQLEAGLTTAKLPVLERTERLSPTGCEALYAVNGAAQEIKAACVSIEDGSPLGRLFDMDVLDRDGRKLDREEVSALATRSLLDEVCTTPKPAWWIGPTTAVIRIWTSSPSPPAPPPSLPTGGGAFRSVGRRPNCPRRRPPPL